MESIRESSMMSEAEVAILLAVHFIEQKGASEAEIALDGAQVMLKGKVIFPVERYLSKRGWKLEKTEGKRRWNGFYTQGGKRLRIHAHSGQGDVVAVIGKRRYYAECKKGPTVRTQSSPEYKLLREAIGQLITISEVKTDDVLIVAVPDSPKFRSLTTSWQSLTAIKRAKISFVCVGRSGTVEWISKKANV